MYGCESWTIKKAECQRIDAFELWCWTILLRVPWTARRSNWSILKKSTMNIHCKDWCWSWSSNTWPPDTKSRLWERSWCWERLRAGEGGDREWDSWMSLQTQWTWVWANSRRSTEKTGNAIVHGVPKSQTWFSHWTITKWEQQPHLPFYMD